MSPQSDKPFRAYLADSVESAIMLAKGELGDDAVLLGSRRLRPDEGGSGQYEVRFAAPPETGIVAAADPAGSRMEREISELRRRLDSMHQSLSRSLLTPPRWMAPSSSLAGLLSQLLGADVDGEIAHGVVDVVHQAGTADPSEALDAARGELARRIRINSDMGARSAGQRIIALAGSPGAGKTTTLVKLAIRYGLTARRSLHLISTDDYRVGGADQLRSFASILGSSFQVAGTPGALAQALEEHRSKDLILIDTPGLSASEMESGNDLIQFIAQKPGIEAHLVLMSSMRSADLYRVWNVFGVYNFARLIFTRTDETAALGGPFSLAARSGTPISFLSTGQGIPEDLECADASRIVDRILPRDPEWRATAAA